MNLSVIIVCHKGWEKLNRCLEALDSFTGHKFSMEVIVVDNNSGDRIIEDFKSRFNRFLFLESHLNGGFAYGCNLGASNASGDILMMLNPDTIVTEEEIGKLLDRSLQLPEKYIISCRQVRSDGREASAVGQFPGKFLTGSSQKKPEKDVSFPDWVSGSIMLMKRETFIGLNGFDESFWMYYEDVDICMRTRKSGGEIVFFNDIVIVHEHGGSSRIDLKTTSLTKTEVQVSRHFYIHKHLTGLTRSLMHSLTIADNIFTGVITGIIGLIFFYIPKLFVRFLIFIRLIDYYSGVLGGKSWMSPRSVKFKSSGNK
jgi:GT2 family glycosyltransferase